MNQTTDPTVTTGPIKMDAIVERLKKEREEAYEEYLTKGHLDGMRWAASASYIDLLYATNHRYHTTIGMYKTYEFSPNEEVWKEFVGEILKEDQRLTYNDLGNPDLLMQSWIEGWFDGISAFWNEVSSKL
jgi:hypothetical protein